MIVPAVSAGGGGLGSLAAGGPLNPISIAQFIRFLSPKRPIQDNGPATFAGHNPDGSPIEGYGDPVFDAQGNIVGYQGDANNPITNNRGQVVNFLEGPGSGPMTNPTTGGMRTIADIAAGVIPNITVNPPDQTGQLPGGQLPPTARIPTQDPTLTPASMAPPSLLSRIFPNLISGGTSLLSGAIGARAAGRAADAQSDAALEAARLNAQAGREANDTIRATSKEQTQLVRDALDQQQRNSQPWIDAGTGALRTIGDITAKPFTLPTEEEAMASPGIQFQLKQGQQALEAYDRAHGTLQSGKAIKEINEFAQGVASQGYDKVTNRKLLERDANLNPQLSVAGLGQVSTAGANANIGDAANRTSGILGDAASNIANVGLNTARTVGDQQTSAAANRASGYLGGAQSWANSLSGIGNSITDTFTIQQLLRQLGKA